LHNHDLLKPKIYKFTYLTKIMSGEKERFFKVYNNLPLEEREMPIIVLDNNPISWKLAYIEISNNTERGKKILEKLLELKLI